jgi:hypothetical protein
MFVPPKLLNTPQNIATIAPSCLGSSNPSAVVLVILSTDPTPRVVSTPHLATGRILWQLPTPLVRCLATVHWYATGDALETRIENDLVPLT